ncbi:preprotein translocase subunit YajC [Pseudonocardia sp. DSM 110487]|uniref:preprotein translocase subunit YajC n=1 Tax=Pseudonocardia sp. DSM 110487 TaxID=2865833 RepID=UPI001C6A6007|nr:preprotein translocase subunit YajC [Pseudonocardia sp. DSM 110487]QYN39681.1 preprotein translocase subunit YajC [Pseudonocardia sp. DSM 110487]
MEYLFPILIALLFIPILLSGRKQRRQMQDMQKMQAALEAGDVVVTTSGLRGTIVDASYEDTLDIEIADGVVTTWVRGAVREKVNPAVTEDASEEESTEATPEEPAAKSLEEPAAAPSLEKSTLEKDESTNGTARS